MARAEPRRQAAARDRFNRSRPPSRLPHAAQERRRHRRGRGLPVARPGRVYRGFLVGRRADPQTAPGSPSRAARLPDVPDLFRRAARVRHVQRSDVRPDARRLARLRRSLRDEHAGDPSGRVRGRRRREGTGADPVRVRRCVRAFRHPARDRPSDRERGRPRAWREPGRGDQPRLLDAEVWRRPGSPRARLRHGRRQGDEHSQVRDRGRDGTAIRRHRAGASDGCLAAVRDVQPAGIRQRRVQLVPHSRPFAGARHGGAGTECRARILLVISPRECTSLRRGEDAHA